MKKVLVVSYTFPPVGGAGVQRVSKFVKYIPMFGWNPIVLTTKNPSVPLTDNALLKDIPENIEIIRTKTLEPSYSTKANIVSSSKNVSVKSLIKSFFRNVVKAILIPDVQILWWFHTSISIKKILKNNNIDLVFVTGPPFSSLLLTVFWSKTYKVPVIVDFRDEWAFSRENWENTSSSKILSYLDLKFEKYVVNKCSNFISVTNTCVDNIRLRSCLCDNKKGVVIYNGFDTEDFDGLQMSDNLSNDHISFFYMGTIWRATSMRSFLSSFNSLSRNSNSFYTSVKLKIVGRIVPEEKIYFDPVLENIEISDYLPHSDALKEASFADILILTISDLPDSDALLPGKIFEYMATGKHVLALIPSGEAQRILQAHYDNFTIINPDDEASIEMFLSQAESRIHELRKISHIDPDIFSRRLLTKKLCEIFDTCL